MQLNREKIQRMFTGSQAYGGGGGGGDTEGLASQLWVDQNYLSKEFFLRLFNIHGEDENDDPVDVQPNDLETTITDIEAMFGFWTEQYLSALGQNSEQGGGGITLNAALASINNAPLGNPTGSNTVLMFNGTTWVYASMGSTDMNTVWTALADGTDTHQINISHLTTALSGYATTSQLSDYATVTDLEQLASYFNTLSGYFTNGAANEAVKLETARTIWGQQFDGTANITGDITQATCLEFSGIAGTATNGGFIDFHYAGGGADYTSRIIEDVSGVLKINNTIWAQLSGNVSIGTSTISQTYKLDIAGYTRTTRLYLADGVYLEYDSTNSGVHLVGAGFYSDSYVSALGVNSGGGGGTDYIPLTGSSSITGTLAPSVATADLGSSTNKWRNIYGTSLSISNTLTTYALTVNSSATVVGSITATNGNLVASTGYVSSAGGYKVTGKDDTYVLLAGGGTKALSTFGSGVSISVNGGTPIDPVSGVISLSGLASTIYVGNTPYAATTAGVVNLPAYPDTSGFVLASSLGSMAYASTSDYVPTTDLSSWVYSSTKPSYTINEISGFKTYWTSTVRIKGWSRILELWGAVTGVSFILEIWGTRNSVVYNNVYVIDTFHPAGARITKIAGSNYTPIGLRVVVENEASGWVEVYDDGVDYDSQTYMTVECSVYRLGGASGYTTISSYTAGSVPSGYDAITLEPSNEAVDLSGGVKAASFKKVNGTSSQFLKADGSVDSNTYATQTWVGQQGYLTSASLSSYVAAIVVNSEQPVAPTSGVVTLSGIVKKIKIGSSSTEYTPSSGVLTLPAYPSGYITGISINGGTPIEPTSGIVGLTGLATTSDLNSYLSLSGGAMLNQNLVSNLNAELLNGHSQNFYITYNKSTLGDNVDFNSISNYCNYGIVIQPIHVPNYSGQTNVPFRDYGTMINFGGNGSLFPFRIAWCMNNAIFIQTGGYKTGTYSGQNWYNIPICTGTSSQFIKADGSFDSNTYATQTWVTSQGYLTSGDVVTTNTAQNITGAKTFTATLTSSAGGSFTGGLRFYSLCVECASDGTPSSSRYGEINRYNNTLHLQYDSGTGGVTMCRQGFLFTNPGTTSQLSTSNNNLQIAVGTGDAYVDKAWVINSDMRKKDIAQYINIDINSIADAPVFNFTWKNDITRQLTLGTSAQYWQKVFPNAVRTTPDGYLGMDYSSIALASAVLTARKVVDHEARIRLLEVENAALRNEINQLKKVA